MKRSVWHTNTGILVSVWHQKDYTSRVIESLPSSLIVFLKIAAFFDAWKQNNGI